MFRQAHKKFLSNEIDGEFSPRNIGWFIYNFENDKEGWFDNIDNSDKTEFSGISASHEGPALILKHSKEPISYLSDLFPVESKEEFVVKANEFIDTVVKLTENNFL